MIDERDLATYFHRPEPDGDAASFRGRKPPGAVPASLEEMERVHIEQVLKQNNFNRTRTAEMLGISKKTLYLKIKRYGLKAPA